jgi:polyisoprenoid-binding protein YceI
MQETHFNENYMESSRYHDATFKGKIIEELNWNQSGKYTVRAKGMLNIHGVEQERIIKADISILPDKTIRIESVFSVLLTDHNIPVPRIVKEKLAEEIKVAVSARLEPHN